MWYVNSLFCKHRRYSELTFTHTIEPEQLIYTFVSILEVYVVVYPQSEDIFFSELDQHFSADVSSLFSSEVKFFLRNRFSSATTVSNQKLGFIKCKTVLVCNLPHISSS
jgi:hypothetical protein